MNDTDTTTAGTDRALDPDRSLRDRVAEKPRPAALWLGGLALLLVVELGRIAGATVRIGELTRWALDRIARLPGQVEMNVAASAGMVGGMVGFTVTALVLLLIAAAVVKSVLVPVSLVSLLGVEQGRDLDELVERLIIAGALGVGAALVVYTPVGAVIDMVIAMFTQALETISSLNTLTSREFISNEGHRLPEGGWEGTFLGLSPAWAWALRVVVIYAYAFALLAWLWKGYNVYRDHYREADWTPRDDVINRFSGHYWGLLGLSIVFAFVVMAIWAPSLGAASVEQNIYQPYEYEFSYLGDDGEVQSIAHGSANLQVRSDGSSSTVGPLSYDAYDRWAPLGTTVDGQDMMTFLVFGARTSLVIGLIAIGLGTAIALALSLITAYYKGVVDALTVIVSDTIISIPAFLFVLLLSVLFQQANHPVAEVYDGGLLLALIFAAVYWPGMWRSIRGPSLQVAEEEWVDAAKSFGQSPGVTMRKHMAPYIATYIMIYSSLLLGSIIIATAALSFLGLGINPPTPEWGRIVAEGRSYVSTQAWHVSTLPGLLIVAVVTGFNAFGDGIRDAIDPESDVDTDTAAAGGGGG